MQGRGIWHVGIWTPHSAGTGEGSTWRAGRDLGETQAPTHLCPLPVKGGTFFEGRMAMGFSQEGVFGHRGPIVLLASHHRSPHLLSLEFPFHPSAG